MQAPDLDHRLACERLCMDFASFVDARRYAELVALFSADGEFNPPGASARGHAELRAFFESRPADIVTRHLCTTIRIEPVAAERRAAGTCSVVMFRGLPGAGAAVPVPSVGNVVDYRDTFVLTADGWRFQQRRVSVVFDIAPPSTVGQV
jgi:hypothetical protein